MNRLAVSPRQRSLAEVILATLVAAAPILASVVRAAPTWRPVGDTAAIALRASDVFSRQTPLVGMPTTLSDSVGQAVHHPGPLEFWVIALGQVIWDHRLVPMLAVAAVNIVAVAGIVLVAGWLAGRPGRVVAALVLVLCTWSLRGEILYDPYNPYAAWLPLGLFAVGLVAVLAGRPWALPIALAGGSYAAQAHVSLVIPVAMAILGALGLTMVSAIAGHRGWSRSLDDARRATAEHRTPILVAGVVFLAVNSPVLLDMAVGRHNLWILAAAAGSDGPIVGFTQAARVVGRALLQPPWLVPDRTTFDLVEPLSWWGIAAGWALIAGGVGLAAIQLRHRPALTATITVALAGLFGGFVAVSRIPANVLSIHALHNVLWLWPFTALFWVGFSGAAVATALDRVGDRPAATDPTRRLERWAVPLLAATAVVVAAVAVVQPPARTSLLAARHGPSTAVVADQIAAAFPSGQRVDIEIVGDLEQSAVAMGLVNELDRRGLRALVPASWGGSFGSHRVAPTHEAAPVLVPLVGHDPDQLVFEDARLVAAHDPDPDDLAVLEEANRMILDRVEAAGGVTFYDGERRTGEDAETMVRSGQLIGLARLGLVVEPVLTASELDRYARAQEGPVLYVRVYQLGG